MWVWVKKLCFINIFTRAFRTADKICRLGSFFLSISVTICRLIIGESMGAIRAVVACYRLYCDVIVSLSDFHRGERRGGAQRGLSSNMNSMTFVIVLRIYSMRKHSLFSNLVISHKAIESLNLVTYLPYLACKYLKS